MFRFAIPILAALTFSSGAMAHPEPQADPKVEFKAPHKLSKMAPPQLPDASEIQDALKQMPDMNEIMGEMMGLMKNEAFRDNMESSARAFGDRLENSGALETGENGMPDFNDAFAVMLETFSDEKAMGGMMETMMGLAGSMEKHIPEIAETSKKPAPKKAQAPELEELHKELKDLRAEVEELRKEKSP